MEVSGGGRSETLFKDGDDDFFEREGDRKQDDTVGEGHSVNGPAGRESPE